MMSGGQLLAGLLLSLAGASLAGQPPPAHSIMPMPNGNAEYSNLMSNSSAEATVDAADYPRNLAGIGGGAATATRLPPGFALCRGSGAVLWGATSAQAHSGTSSVFLTFKDWQTIEGIKRVSADIVLAMSDGYNGAQAMPASAGDWYFSFWVKGDLPLLTTRVIVWNDDAGKPTQRGKVVTPALDIVPRSVWQKVQGRFTLDPSVRRFALCIHLDNVAGLVPEQTLYLDDVSIRRLTATPLGAAPGAPSVAIYDNGMSGKLDRQPLYGTLAEAGLAVHAIADLRRETLAPYDVLILSGVDTLSPIDAGDVDRGIPGTDWPTSVLNFVDNGKGIILGHSSTGWRGVFASPSLAPSIAVGIGENHENHALTVTARTHPVMNGVPASFAHTCSNHVILTTGRAGSVLAVDAAGNAVIAAGDLSRGRVVALGYPMGGVTGDAKQACAPGGVAPLSPEEKTVLVNSVRWAAGRPRYEVPEEITVATLLADAKRYDEAMGTTVMAKYKALPHPRFDESILWTYLFMGGSVPMRLDTPEKIGQVLDNCKRMHFTTALTIAKSGYFLYDSHRFPNEEHRFCTNGFDPLATFVSGARKRGLRVGLIVEPFKNSREWRRFAPDLTQEEANRIRRGDLKLEDVDKDRPWARFNCPDHPDVRERALAIAEEIIHTFDPDIVYLDYIRYKTGYDTSCFCDYSMACKADFAKRHPELAPVDVAPAYAEESLVSFVADWVRRCKQAKPSILTSCYTISAPRAKAPAWVNRYPVDFHSKYVSRNVYGPESSIEDVGRMTRTYDAWLHEAKGTTVFSPIIASYEYKTPERLIAEFKLVSRALDETKPARRMVEYYDYTFLMRGQDYKIDEDFAAAIASVLDGGSDGP